ncbi:hypothetical protein ACFX12_018028 [Malus domestica]
MFPEAHIKHLAKTISDHTLVLITLESKHIPNPEFKPFRFEVMWMKHECFKHYLESNWKSQDVGINQKLGFLSGKLRWWNKNMFGRLEWKRRRLLARIEGVQKALCNNCWPFLLRLNTSLSKEYNNLLEQEEIFWKQKSRVKWLQEGDRNTRFFHLSTIIRRRRNKIEGLWNNDGVWVEDKEDLKQIAVHHFCSLFAYSFYGTSNGVMPNLFSYVDQSLLGALKEDVSLQEVKDSLFSIGALKALGPDGYPAAFFQNFWELCSSDILCLITECFKKGSIPDGLGSTLITFIPKVDGLQDISQFRPISLCSTLYKVVTKILVNRLRPIMKSIINPNQVSFIPGRHITDNIIIAQEVLHTFSITRGARGYMAWKIDLSKAYDRLRCDFIREVLVEVGIDDLTVKLIIMDCVSKVDYKIVVNRECSTSFRPERGVRQGDPLSPYLFVLCVEKLGHFISEDVSNKCWKPVKMAKKGPAISHLFFANDIILFSEASISQAKVVKRCLDTFCCLSGQQISFEKSQIFCSSNVDSGVADLISEICGSPIVQDLGKYLGVPLIHSRINSSTYMEVVNKVQSRLSAWKANTLSFAGRTTLIQAVTLAIPVYVMQTAKLPVSTCDLIDGLNRKFLWGSFEVKSKTCLVRWSSVCLPKNKGGLGLKRMKYMNVALLANSSWRLLQRDDGLWASTFRGNYLSGVNSDILKWPTGRVASSSWKAVVYGG